MQIIDAFGLNLKIMFYMFAQFGKMPGKCDRKGVFIYESIDDFVNKTTIYSWYLSDGIHLLVILIIAQSNRR